MTICPDSRGISLCCVVLPAIQDAEHLSIHRSMDVSSISSTTPTPFISSVAATQTAPVSTSAISGSASSPNLSKMGSLMSKLQDLEQTDPAKAKSVLAKISQDLKATGDSKLSALADKFDQASQSGDLSVLKPKTGGHHHGGGHHKMAAYAQQQQSGSDPMSQVESIISSDLS